MNEEYEWEEHELEEFSDLAIKTLRTFINTELQFVKKEHELKTNLLSYDYLLWQLSGRIPGNMRHLDKLNDDIFNKLKEIIDLIESGKFEEIRIEKEEVQLLQQLEKNVEHRNWKAVREVLDSEIKEEKQVVRLQIHELKELHSKFKDLMRLMKKNNLIEAINKDLTIRKQKRGFERLEKLEEYYFFQIYKFARAYERIFRHLWRKERILARELKRDSKRMG